jgi:hypothetical protein
MNVEHYDRFFVLSATALGLVLTGAANLALGVRSGRRVALRAIVSVGICAGIVAGVSAMFRDALAYRTAYFLGGILLAITVSGSEWLSRNIASAIAFVRRPACRWGVLTVGGIGLAISSIIAFEKSDEDQIAKNTENLEMTVGTQPHQTARGHRAVTDAGQEIILKEPLAAREAERLTPTERKVIENAHLDEEVIRIAPANDSSNCHGWVFTGGKCLLSPDMVEVILKDNHYVAVQDPQPGDLVIYRQNGAIAHTATVSYVTEGKPVMVEGKWGTMGVFLHSVEKSVYGNEYTYYRSSRHGHLLVGLGGASPNPNVTAPPVVVSE